MAGQAGDVHSTRQQLKRRAPCQQMNVNQQWSAHSRIRISPCTVTSSGQIHTRKLPLTLCRLRRQCCYLRLQIWPEGLRVDVWDVVFSCGSAHGFVWVGYLMTLYNPSHKYPYMVSCTMLNFEALQWITLRNRVCNLSALNLYGMSFKGTLFLLEDMPFQNTTHPFRNALCDL